MMLVTEAEARKCWCPFSRTAKEWLGVERHSATGQPLDQRMLSVAVNRGAGTEDRCRCISRECMAWRWGEEPNPKYGTGMSTTEPETAPAYRRTPVKDSPGHFDNEPLGFCGLAGRP